MTENATRRFESDASTADHRPTSEADGETVHTTGNWRLMVRTDGRVEAIEHTPDGAKQWTTTDNDRAPPRASYRYGKTIEGILARYAHETRFDRDPHTENGAALRDGIIDALQSVATNTVCGRRECDHCAAYVVHTNAPTGPTTALVCDDDATEGTYTTLYALDTDTNTDAEEGTESAEVEPAWPCPNCGSADYNWQTSGAYASKSCDDCGQFEMR